MQRKAVNQFFQNFWSVMKSWEVIFCTQGTVCVCVCALTSWGEIEEENMFGKESEKVCVCVCVYMFW